MKKLLIAMILTGLCVACSTKERTENTHMMNDELQDIQKAKDAAKLADSVNANMTNMADSLMKQAGPTDSVQ